MTTAPYGSWPSPVTAELIVEASVSLGRPAFGGGDLWWSELRPTEGGRVQIVRKPLGGAPDSARDVLPEGFSARTRVHEYGGGAWWLHDETLFFVNWADQRLYRLDPDPGAEPVAITPEPATPQGLRYANGTLTPDGRWVVCVREWHGADGATEARNQLVAVPVDGSAEPTVLVGVDGDDNLPDFVSSPRISPDGKQLRWIQWNHPDMPWDRTVMGRGQLVERDGRLLVEGVKAKDKRVQSTTQPEFGPGGDAYSVSDISGRWRIWLNGLVPRPIVPDDAEWGQPAWVFGQSWYAFTGDGRGLVAVSRKDGRDRLHWIPAIEGEAAGGVSQLMSAIESGVRKTAAWGAPIELDTPFTSIEGVTAGPDATVALIGASFTGEAEVVTIDTTGAGTGRVAVTVHRPARDLGIGDDWLSVPEHISYLTTGGATAYGLYYPPTNPDASGPEGTLPPLVVLSHGGPTGAARPQLNLGTQYWTSRGFAVVDVNYRGSTGYGRRFREALNGQWGIVDVEDCRAAAVALAQVGLVDPQRLVIRGGSAGGYTTLRVLAAGGFAAGASHFGVTDLEALARDTHKFESRYLDGLIGPYPETREVYVERSPITHVDELKTPLIILQGLDDQIVPPSQAEVLVQAMRANKVPHAYLTFEGEDHGFRQAATIRRALEAELYFYGQVLGFEPADDLEPVDIEFL